MITVFSFLLFSFVCFFWFYLPGNWIIKKLKIFYSNVLTETTIAIAVGISLFLIGNYLLAWLHLQFLYLLIVLPAIFLELPIFVHRLHKHFSLRWVFSFESIIIFFGTVCMAFATVTSGMMEGQNLVFYGTNAFDGIFHSALIGNIASQFPPSFPGLSNTMLRGYHILYDFMVAQFVVLFGFSVFDLYFRFFSIFTALFYGFSGLTLSFALKMNSLTRRVFLFLLFFAQGGEYFFFHWFHNTYNQYNSGIVQPAGNIVDPSVLLSIAFVFLLFVVLFSFKKGWTMIPAILFLGILPGIKIYTGILTYAAVGIVAILFLFKKNSTYIFLLIFSGILSAIVYLPFNLGAGSLLYNPFLFIRHFMESDTIFASFQWPLKLQYYQEHHNFLRIFYLYGIALLIYFIPPLGIRLVSLVKLKEILYKKFYTPQHVFWMVFIGIGVFIPLFFIQSIAVFNVVQFFWIAWIALLIPTAFSLTQLLGKITMRKTTTLFLCLSFLSLPIFIFLFLIYHSAVLKVDKNLYDIAQEIRLTIPEKDTILVVNRQAQNGTFVNLYEVPLLAALSGRPMFYEPEQAEFPKITSIEASRMKIVEEIRSNLDMCSTMTNTTLLHILQAEHVQYILFLDTNGCIGKLHSFKEVIQKGNYSLIKRI